jgi:DNA replicative helicase MCM subunit Mcm2 (Cdc46/Mcm family)
MSSSSSSPSSSPSDRLLPTDALKDYGVTAITRHGSIGRGFAIQVMIYDKPLVFAADTSWRTMLNDMAKKLNASYYFKGDTKTVDRIKQDFQALLEAFLIQNNAWVTGQDVKNFQSGYTKSIDNDDKLSSSSIDKEPKVLSIPDAIRAHSGDVIVVGVIVTISDTYKLIKNAKWKCQTCKEPIEKEVINILDIPLKPKECTNENCGSKAGFIDEHEYINAVSLKLQSENVSDDHSLGSLHVVVFGDDTYSIQVGERANVLGKIVNHQDPRTKRFSTVLLAQKIQYEHRRRVEVTPDDIRAFKKFMKFPKFEERLVSMFASDIIGNYDNKLTIILSAIGAPEYYNKETKRISVRGRISILLIGPPGEGKTKLGNEAVKLRITSKRVSGKNTTGGSLTAMILMDNDQLTLHLGAAAHANDGILFVNEYDKTPEESRDNLLEVIEEAEIIVNKFAQLVDIPARATLLASANPRNEKWMYPNEITLEEIPFTLRELSRFDAVLIFRDESSKEADTKYAYAKTSNIEKHINTNCNFLQKLIEYVKTEIDPILTTHAEGILNQYWVNLRDDKELTYFVDKRTLEVIHRFAKAFARMNLSYVVDKKIANRTIDFMNKMFINFNLKLIKKNDPFMDSYTKIINVLKTKTNPKKSVELISTIQSLCLRDEEMRAYIGTVFQQNANKKLHSMCKKILENQHIKRTGAHPIKVYWKSDDKILSDFSDLSATKKLPSTPQNKKNSLVNSLVKKNKNRVGGSLSARTKVTKVTKK